MIRLNNNLTIFVAGGWSSCFGTLHLWNTVNGNKKGEGKRTFRRTVSEKVRSLQEREGEREERGERVCGRVKRAGPGHGAFCRLTDQRCIHTDNIYMYSIEVP